MLMRYPLRGCAIDDVTIKAVWWEIDNWYTLQYNQIAFRIHHKEVIFERANVYFCIYVTDNVQLVLLCLIILYFNSMMFGNLHGLEIFVIWKLELRKYDNSVGTKGIFK